MLFFRKKEILMHVAYLQNQDRTQLLAHIHGEMILGGQEHADRQPVGLLFDVTTSDRRIEQFALPIIFQGVTLYLNPRQILENYRVGIVFPDENPISIELLTAFIFLGRCQEDPAAGAIHHHTLISCMQDDQPFRAAVNQVIESENHIPAISKFILASARKLEIDLMWRLFLKFEGEDRGLKGEAVRAALLCPEITPQQAVDLFNLIPLIELNSEDYSYVLKSLIAKKWEDMAIVALDQRHQDIPGHLRGDIFQEAGRRGVVSVMQRLHTDDHPVSEKSMVATFSDLAVMELPEDQKLACLNFIAEKANRWISYQNRGVIAVKAAAQRYLDLTVQILRSGPIYFYQRNEISDYLGDHRERILAVCQVVPPLVRQHAVHPLYARRGALEGVERRLAGVDLGQGPEEVEGMDEGGDTTDDDEEWVS
jgi:hypothetical protein